MGKLTTRDIDVAGKTVLVRADLNVPLDGDRITDDTRIRGSLPTIRLLLESGAAVVLCSHLGRPKGVTPELSLGPVAKRLGELLSTDVELSVDCVGAQARALVDSLEPGNVLLLENLRFHPEEVQNDSTFSRQLAAGADFFVNDAFGAAHRAHASTEGVTHFLPSVAGLLMEKEVRYLSALVADPPRPFAALVGGAKVSTKIPALRHLLPGLNVLLVGGGMANTFLKAQGHAVGSSLVEDDQVEIAVQILADAGEKGVNVRLPVDVVVAERMAEDARVETVAVSAVPAGSMILDVGPQTVEDYGQALAPTATVVWNGPMGVFEMSPFAGGSLGMARVLSELSAVTVVGGGETAAVVAISGLAERFTHISTGGGASLEMLEGKPLPGVSSLMDVTN
ncbi:MAG TPA: phosphoglycerate kinase [Dehalococcoidia bacterium]|nr:phosphoglycerate kinase [Dehalococcoidia bacterium]